MGSWHTWFPRDGKQAHDSNIPQGDRNMPKSLHDEKNRKLLASSAKNDYLCSTQGMNDGDTLHCCSMKRTGHRNDWQRGEHHIHRIAQWQLPLPEARRCLMEFSNSKGGFY